MSANNSKPSSKQLDARDKAAQIAIARTGAIVGITVNTTILYVLKDVKSESCQCTDDLRYTFCYYYSMVLILLNTVYLVMGSKKQLEGVMPFINAMNLFNVGCLVSYLHELASSKCNCEYTDVQKMIRYGYTIIAFFYAIGIIYSIFFVLALMTQK
jgi:hypothetical protein